MRTVQPRFSPRGLNVSAVLLCVAKEHDTEQAVRHTLFLLYMDVKANHKECALKGRA